MKKFIEEFKTFALRGNVMVNFIIMAFILFCLMKGINRLVGLTKKKSRQNRPRRSVRTVRVRSVLKQVGAHIAHRYLKKQNQNNPGKSSVQIMRRAF